MPGEKTRAHAEREQTDESLRVERERVDHALEAKLSNLEAQADAVIRRARARADEVLAAARANVDRQSPAMTPSATTERDRGRADDTVRSERARADAAIRAERIEHVSLLATERDETDKDLSSERARADVALATRDEFLGLVSHDLRGLLNNVMGYAQLIEQVVSGSPATDLVLRYTRSILRSGGRMDSLIGDLVDVASIDAGRLAVTRELGDPGEVAAEVVDTFRAQAAASGLSLVLEVASSGLRVPLDPARILQVLTHLVLDALKIAPPGGRLTVRVERVGEAARFTVSGMGPGIAAGALEGVFERYAQVLEDDRRGAGLGLYISKCIVEGHGGRIWAERAAGGGTSFCFALPVDPGARRG